MSVRRYFAVAAALLGALFFATGCSDRDGAQVAAETDDPYYIQGVQLKRQGRNPEALTSFLKVIDKRGERGAAESHLHAGDIYLNYVKDPLYAYYHFRKYLELQPNSTQAELVRGQVKAAAREFAKTIPGRPSEETAVRLQANEEIGKMQRELEELRAELAVLRGGGATAVNRSARIIPLPVQSPASAAQAPSSSGAATPITAAPQRSVAPAPTTAATRAVASPTSTPARVGTPSRGSATTPSGRSHTVVAKDTLFNLSKRYGVKVEELAAANGMAVSSPLKLGTVLKIPAPTTAGR